MPKRVLIIGGYGTFGTYIARRLASNKGLRLIIAGRSREQANQMASSLPAANPAVSAALDIRGKLDRALEVLAPDIVLHTSGPFQEQEPFVAAACIRQGCHYIDLADGRAFVSAIGTLDEAARNAGLSVISGASSVPALSSAVLDRYEEEFQTLEAVEYGIATAQHTNTGLATTSAVMSYAGKPMETLIDGHMQKLYGWQGLVRRPFGPLGQRWLANCDVPDLDLFPKRYPSLKTIRFRAGLEIPLLQLGFWGLTWLVRAGLLRNMAKLAPSMLRLSRLFDPFGSNNSGFYMTMKGQGHDGNPKQVQFDLTARSGDGPFIPCMPAILLTERLVAGEDVPTGAMPCMGLVSLQDYLAALTSLDISWQTTGAEPA